MNKKTLFYIGFIGVFCWDLTNYMFLILINNVQSFHKFKYTKIKKIYNIQFN